MWAMLAVYFLAFLAWTVRGTGQAQQTKQCLADAVRGGLSNVVEACDVNAQLNDCRAALTTCRNTLGLRAALVERGPESPSTLAYATSTPDSAFDELTNAVRERFHGVDEGHDLVFSYMVPLGASEREMTVANDADLRAAFALAKDWGFDLLLRTKLVTDVPTTSPTLMPSNVPTTSPTLVPTTGPTSSPTTRPSVSPTAECMKWEDDMSGAGWSNGKITNSVVEGKVHGPFAKDNQQVSTTVDFMPNLQVKLTMRVMSLDSPDNEYVAVSVNGVEIFRKSRTPGSPGHGCTPYGWDVYPRTQQLPRGIDFYQWQNDHDNCYKDIKHVFTVPASGKVNIRVSSNMGEDVGNESYAFNALTLEQLNCNDCEWEDDMTGAGWSNGKITDTIVEGKIHGPFANENQQASTTVDFKPSVRAKLTMRVMSLDSPDNEYIAVSVNGVEIFRKSRTPGSPGHGCTPYGWDVYPRTQQFPRGIDFYQWQNDHDNCYKDIEHEFTVPANGKVNIRVSSNMGEDVGNESYAFNRLRIECT